jgi:hypothetical protein
MTKPVLTGPDYLIGAAERLKTEIPLAGEFQSMLFAAFPIDPAVEGPAPLELTRELQPHEEAAQAVFRAAVLVAIQRKDHAAIEELLGWGLAMLLRFDGYHESKVRGGPRFPPPPE